MEKFVKELSDDLEKLEQEIAKVKEEIQSYNIKGATTDSKKRELKLVNQHSLYFLRIKLLPFSNSPRESCKKKRRKQYSKHNMRSL